LHGSEKEDEGNTIGLGVNPETNLGLIGVGTGFNFSVQFNPVEQKTESEGNSTSQGVNQTVNLGSFGLRKGFDFSTQYNSLKDQDQSIIGNGME